MNGRLMLIGKGLSAYEAGSDIDEEENVWSDRLRSALSRSKLSTDDVVRGIGQMFHRFESLTLNVETGALKGSGPR